MQDEEKLNQVYDDVLGEPDELLGYMILGMDTTEKECTIDNETHILWQDEESVEKLTGNTHGCWGFFPVVN